MRVLPLLLGIVAATPALGVAGTITGTIVGPEFRSNAYLAAGCGSSPSGARQVFAGGANIPVSEALVRVRVVDLVTGVYSFYSRTNGSGVYTIPWSTPGLVTSVDVYVYPERPNIGSTTIVTSKPSAQFRIGSGGVVFGVFGVTGPFGGTQTRNITTTGSEHLNAFVTTREYYNMLDAHGTPLTGGSIRNDMLGVDVHVNYNVPNPTAPFDSEVYLPADSATDTPTTTSHELGHILVWRSLDLPQSLIDPVVDYGGNFSGCSQGSNGGAWSRWSCEHEKAAFHEGFPDMVAGLWMWFRDATAIGCPNSRPHFFAVSDGEAVDLEAAGICDNGGSWTEKKPICNARGLWDVVDAPPSDGDGIQSRDLSDIVTALRRYPRNCQPCVISDNRCSNEGWPWSPFCLNDQNGSNWKDFEANWGIDFGGSSLNTIESGNGLSGGDNG